jgi:hypothetical protein
MEMENESESLDKTLRELELNYADPGENALEQILNDKQNQINLLKDKIDKLEGDFQYVENNYKNHDRFDDDFEFDLKLDNGNYINFCLKKYKKIKQFCLTKDKEKEPIENNVTFQRKSQIIPNKSKTLQKSFLNENPGNKSGFRSRFKSVLNSMNQTSSQLDLNEQPSLLSTSRLDLSSSYLGKGHTSKYKQESSGSKFVDDMNSRMNNLLGRFAQKKIKRNRFG